MSLDIFETIGGPVILADGTIIPISKAVKAGPFLLLSGQLAFNKDGIIKGDISMQTRRCFNNIELILNSAGLSLASIVKVTAWLSKQEDFAVFNKEYERIISNPYPARSTVRCDLLVPNALIEVEVMALL